LPSAQEAGQVLIGEAISQSAMPSILVRPVFRELGLELSRFLTPPDVADHRNAPVNALVMSLGSLFLYRMNRL
jgi:hypothetical protein